MNRVRFPRSPKPSDAMKFLLLALTLFLTEPYLCYAQNEPCKFDVTTLQFEGSPVEQAKCLLRPVKPRGILGQKLRKLPGKLNKLIGKKVKLESADLNEYLNKPSIQADKSLGGALGEHLATEKLSDGTEMKALYFIIHDTSTPNYGSGDFPPDVNDKSWKFNNLDTHLRNPVAHVFVNRLGESITTTPFSEPVRKGFGTKFARDFLKSEAKGIQLHIELIQPRRGDLTWFTGNDGIAPSPGFTDKQYERLALLYICASFRRGTWLIPAYHCAVDAGIKDAHDDPQNFELEKFDDFLKRLLKEIG